MADQILRAATIALALLLSGCAAEQQADPPPVEVPAVEMPPVETPPNETSGSAFEPDAAEATTPPPPVPVTPVPTLDARFPGAQLRPVAHVPADVAAAMAGTACRVSREDTPAPPDGIARVATSPDGTNRLYANAGYGGGDHNVFDELDGVFSAETDVAVLTTPEARYTLRSSSPFGFYVHIARGELSCTALREGLPPDDIGPLRHHVHTADIRATTEVFVRGRKRGSCLTVLDENSVEYIAAFAAPLPAPVAYAVLRRGERFDAPMDEWAWGLPRPTAVAGVKVALPNPDPECGGLSHAVLFRSPPRWRGSRLVLDAAD